MKLKNQILLGVGIGLGSVLIGAVYTEITAKKMQKDLEKEFYEKESVQEIIESTETKADELMEDLASEASSHLAEVQAELDKIMADWTERQNKHMEEFSKICSGEK